MATTTGDYKSYLTQLEDTLQLYFGQKAPPMPTNIKEVIVQFAPWVTLIIMILALPLLLGVLGLGALFAPFSFLGGVNAGFSYMVTMVLTLVSVILEALAIPGLFGRTRGGWNLVYYSTLVGVVQSVLTFQLGGLIGAAIAFYILFQVREYYK